MTSFLPLRDLGKAGIAPDQLPFSLAPHVFSYAENVYFSHGRVGKTLGWEEFDFGVETPFAADQLWFQSWNYAGSTRTVFCGASALTVWNGTALSAPSVDSPALGTATAWSSAVFGDYVVINNGVSPPRHSGAGTAFSKLPGWEAAFGSGAVCAGIVAYRGFLFAWGVGGDDYSYYWSDESPLNSFPTSWDYTDTTKLAGFDSVLADDGPIVGAKVLGNRLIVYTRYAAYSVTLGGQFVFQQTRLFGMGLAAPDAVIEYGNAHVAVGTNGVYAHQAATPSRIADNVIEQFMYSDMTSLDGITSSHNEFEHEVAFLYANSGNAKPRAAIFWSWLENTWTRMTFPFDVMRIDASEQGEALIDWSEITTTWDAESRTWAEMLQTDPRRRMMMLGKRAWYVMDRGFQRATDSGMQDYHAYAERLFLDLTSVLKSSVPYTAVTAIYPRIRGIGKVNFQVGYSIGTNDAPSWAQVQQFDCDVSGSFRVPVRTTGRWLHYRIGSWDGTPNPGWWEIDGIDLEVVTEGPR